MFSKLPDASKAAMIWLSQNGQYDLVDCQVPNDHLMGMGAEMIPREAYMQFLHGD